MNKLVFTSCGLLLVLSLTLCGANEVDDIISLSNVWRSAGYYAAVESVFSINVQAIPDSATYVQDGLDIPIPSAIPNDGIDDSFTFKNLIIWMKDNVANQNVHAQIYVPSGIYDFKDQLVMYSNISIKGAGSDSTMFRFNIVSDSTMTSADCRKDAILVKGSDDANISKVGIEDIKIIRVRDENLTREEVYDWVYPMNGNFYPGNNIALVYANNCWIKGVHSENTFRNHVTLEFANHCKFQIKDYNKAER